MRGTLCFLQLTNVTLFMYEFVVVGDLMQLGSSGVKRATFLDSVPSSSLQHVSGTTLKKEGGHHCHETDLNLDQTIGLQ